MPSNGTKGLFANRISLSSARPRSGRLRVLHINISDRYLSGGTGIAMHRLHQTYRNNNVQSNVVCAATKTDTEFTDSGEIIDDDGGGVFKIAWHRRSFFEKVLDRVLLKFLSFLGIELAFHKVTTALAIKRDPLYQDADVLHLHCMHGGYFSFLTLPVIAHENKPAVYTLHDMWPITGHCTYSYDCERWKTGCGQCPYPEVYPPIQKDNTHLEWQLKKWALQRSNVAIVCPSLWMYNLVRQSIAKDLPLYHVPNGVDTEVFRPLDRASSRSQLGIPLDKKVLLFGAASLQDKRKGSDLLLSALQQLPKTLKQQLVLLIMGDGWEADAQSVGIESLNLGYVSSDAAKAVAFSASDLFVFPTRADNMPLILQESMACGVPMISFDVGGVPELVRPGITGYLAESENATDFRDGIAKLLENDLLREQISKQCREIAIQEYSLEQISQQYLQVYRESLERFQEST